MNQAEYRKRLRDQRAKEEQRSLTAFSASPQAPAPIIKEGTLADVAATPTLVQPEAPVPVPVASPAIVPEAVQATMTPQQLRDQARSTAALLAGLPQEEYQASLTSLSQSNPTLYEVVVDELNNLAAQNGQSEDDGFDLSGIANNPATPSQGGTNAAQTPEAQ